MNRDPHPRDVSLRYAATASMVAALVGGFPGLVLAQNAPAVASVAAVRNIAPRSADQRLEPGVPVFGIVVAGEPRAYAIADLQHAGAAIHDIVSGRAIDVGFESDEARVIAPAQAAGEHRTTKWGDWIRVHPDTSLWRIPAVAEPAPRRPASDVRVKESHHYRTAFGCTVMPTRLTAASAEPPSLVVISGTIENVASDAVDHVVLRYELVDGRGEVLYREEGFNRSAEALAAPQLDSTDRVVPIDAGATDTFRMILLSDELPRFESARVSVSRVY